MVIDVERPEPALLPHGDGDEIAELDDLRLGEMTPQPRPERITRLEIPSNRLGISERRLLPLVVARRAFEIEQVYVIGFLETLLRGFYRALVAAIFALDRARHIDAAQFLDRMVHDAVAKDAVPGLGEGPEGVRNMGADRLAFGPRRAFAPAALELREHLRIRYRRRIDV